MFDMINDIALVVFFCALFVFGMLAVIQYSRFEKHRKAHIEDDDDSREWILASKFAPIPYLLVPALFGILAIFCSLVGTRILVERGIVDGIEVTCQAVFLSVIIYMIMDKVIVRQCGDALYFDTIEDKLFRTVSENIPVVVSESGTVSLSRADYEKLILGNKVKK